MLSDFMAVCSSSLFGCASVMVESSCLLKSSCLSALHLCQHSVAAILRVDCPFLKFYSGNCMCQVFLRVTVLVVSGTLGLFL